MRIELDLCVIRPWSRTDKHSLVLHGNNYEVWRNLTDVFPHPYTSEDADQWFSVLETQNPLTAFAIEVDGQAVGGIGYTPLSGMYCKTAEFGYWLGEAYWNRDIATAAVQAMVKCIFNELPFMRLEAGVFEWNPASMRVLEKAGFAREGVLRKSVFKDGQLIDRMLYAITRES